MGEARRQRRATEPRLLRRAMAANAVFSGVSGAALLVAAGPLGAWLGVTEEWILRALGGGLVAFAVGLAALVRAPVPERAWVLAASLADLAWVAGSVALLAGFPGLLTAAGKTAVGAVAAVVAALAAGQLVGLRRVRGG